jgi:hypothetical protein
VRLERGPKGIEATPLHLQAGRRPVAPVARQVAGAGVQAGEQVVGGDRASRAAPPVAVEGDQHRRAVVALGQPRGDDPDDARVPILAREHVGRPLAGLGDLRLGGEQDARLDVAALGVGHVELARRRLGAPLVLGEHELETGVGATQTAGGVDPGSEAESDGAGVEHGRLDLGHPHQGPQAGLGGDGQRAEPPAHDGPVLPAQRDAVGDRGEGDEVEVLVGPARRTGGLQGEG